MLNQIIDQFFRDKSFSWQDKSSSQNIQEIRIYIVSVTKKITVVKWWPYINLAEHWFSRVLELTCVVDNYKANSWINFSWERTTTSICCMPSGTSLRQSQYQSMSPELKICAYWDTARACAVRTMFLIFRPMVDICQRIVRPKARTYRTDHWMASLPRPKSHLRQCTDAEPFSKEQRCDLRHHP